MQAKSSQRSEESFNEFGRYSHVAHPSTFGRVIVNEHLEGHRGLKWTKQDLDERSDPSSLTERWKQGLQF